MTAPLADAAARERIRADLDATLVVEAAAGTARPRSWWRASSPGAHRRTTLDRILSVTFTDLAAGEMKLRLRADLEVARAGATAEERDRLTAALERLEAAPIGTIHSFCADLLRERPVEAQVDPVFEVAAGEEQERLFDQAFDAWFQRAVADPPEGVRRLLRRKVRPAISRRASSCATRDAISPSTATSRRLEARAVRSGGGAGADGALLAEVGEIARKRSAPTTGPRNPWRRSRAGAPSCARREAVRRATPTGWRPSCTSLPGVVCGTGRGGGKWFAKDLEKSAVLARREAAKADLQASSIAATPTSPHACARSCGRSARPMRP